MSVAAIKDADARRVAQDLLAGRNTNTAGVKDAETRRVLEGVRQVLVRPGAAAPSLTGVSDPALRFVLSDLLAGRAA